MFRLPLILLAALGVTVCFSRADEPEVFTIKTLQAQMSYDVSELVITPGAQVKIIFENIDDMPHNMVFFQPGTDVVAVSNEQMQRPEEALKRNWLPEDPRMWLHSKMLMPKQTEEIVFKAPEKPGIYPFVCTFPGHAVTMQGRLKIFAPGPQLTSLRYQVYLGDWKKLPDFSTLTPHREGEVPDNLVQLKFDDYKNQYGVVYTGKLHAPKDGEYTFAVAGDDGVRILIDGKKVVEHDGIHPSAEIREGKTRLKAGDHDFRLEYFQAEGEAEVYASWRGAEFAVTPLSKWVHPDWKAGSLAKKKDNTTGMPLVVGNEPIVYRNFIDGAGNRGIAVGYPGGFNLAWSAESMNAALLWRGAFMDAARHWIDRGGGHQPPLGYDVIRLSSGKTLPFGTATSAGATWPGLEKGQRADGLPWKGYQLDKQRVPTFHYTWNDLAVSDRFEPEGDALAGTGKLHRKVRIEGNIPEGTLFCVASAGKIKTAGEAFLVEGGRFNLVGREFESNFW
jgi:azurin